MRRTLLLASLLLLCGAAILGGCAGNDATLPSPTATPTAAPAQDLVDTAWQLELLYGEPLIPDTEIPLYFQESMFGGVMTCNDYGGGLDSGAYTATADGALAVAMVEITVIYCVEPPGVVEQESAYVDALIQIRSYQIMADRLKLFDADGNLILEFSRRK